MYVMCLIKNGHARARVGGIERDTCSAVGCVFDGGRFRSTLDEHRGRTRNTSVRSAVDIAKVVALRLLYIEIVVRPRSRYHNRPS
jgi:hypothetical protein